MNTLQKTTLEKTLDTYLGNSELINHMRQGLAVILVNLKTEEVTGATPLANHIFGWDTLIGRTLKDLLPEKFHDSHTEYVKGYAQRPKVVRMGDRRLPCRRRNGTQFTASIWLIPSADHLSAMCVLFE